MLGKNIWIKHDEYYEGRTRKGEKFYIDIEDFELVRKTTVYRIFYIINNKEELKWDINQMN